MAVASQARPAVVHAPDAIHVISARREGVLARFGEVWHNRALVAWFGRKFVERMYANTALGWWWIPLRPILSVVPRALIFGGILNAPSNGTPYLLFFLVGISGWDILNRTWYLGTRCFQMSGRYLKRMWLPRTAPLVAVGASGLVEYLLYTAFAVLVVGYYVLFENQFPLSLGVNTLLLPLSIAMILGLALALSSWTSVIGAHGRDTRWTVRAILHVWMLLTPVIYPLSAVPGGYKTIVELNPMTAPMEMLRKAMFGIGDITALSVGITVGSILLIGGFGMAFFDRSEATALDYM